MRITLFVLLVFELNLFVGLVGCNTTEPSSNLQINVEDISCTEAWINLTGQTGSEVILNRNDKEVQRFTLTASPQTVYDGSLLPNKTYTYQAIRNNETSNKLVVTTLDTTSSNFTFETYEFGDGYSSSYFNDVWVFSENNIWAVGYISPEDTTINGVHITNPNIIKWDGQSWKIQPYSGTSSGIYGIWALDTSNIYFANGLVEKYEKGSYKYYDFSGMDFSGGRGIYRLWGNKNENIYGVGLAGTIVHFDGSKWTQIDFDQQWHFYQITGNKETGVGYAIAINPSSDCIIVKLENSTTDIFYQQSKSEIKILSVTLTELNNFLYLPNDWQNSICRINEKTGKVEVIYQITGSFGIEQSAAFNNNDIYYFGPDYSGIGVWLLHFNGISYKMTAITSIDRDNLGSLYAVRNLAVSVGFTNNKAYLIKIKRQ